MNQTIIELLTVSCPLGLAKWKISFLVTGFVIIVLIYLFSRLRLLSNEAKKRGLKGLFSGGGSAKDPINKSISTGVYDLPEMTDGSSLDDVINKTKSKQEGLRLGARGLRSGIRNPKPQTPSPKPNGPPTNKKQKKGCRHKPQAKTDQSDNDFWKSVIDNPDIPEYE